MIIPNYEIIIIGTSVANNLANYQNFGNLLNYFITKPINVSNKKNLRGLIGVQSFSFGRPAKAKALDSK